VYGAVFPEPEGLLTQIPKVPGTDGRKMSKSYDNCIDLSDPPEVITPKIKTMMTDPARKRRSDPGNPEVCPVFDLHKIFTSEADREACATGCRTAGIGCLDCKGVLLKYLLPPLGEIHERRSKVMEKPAFVLETLRHGSERARQTARDTMERVREAMGITP
jgi:tryptophanyl-tRNA synthetase